MEEMNPPATCSCECTAYHWRGDLMVPRSPTVRAKSSSNRIRNPASRNARNPGSPLESTELPTFLRAMQCLARSQKVRPRFEAT
jgi:hypothetical protein